MATEKYISLPGGLKMPALGYGTWQVLFYLKFRVTNIVRSLAMLRSFGFVKKCFIGLFLLCYLRYIKKAAVLDCGKCVYQIYCCTTRLFAVELMLSNSNYLITVLKLNNQK